MLQAQIYIDRDDLHQGQVLYEYIFKLLQFHKITGATVFQGIAGYGSNKFFIRPNDLFSFDEVPVMITFIDEDDKVRAALTAIRAEIKRGYIITFPVEKWSND